MKALDLNQEEREFLLDVLKRRLAELDHEIAHTHYTEYRQMLRARRSVLEGIVGKLPALVGHAA